MRTGVSTRCKAGGGSAGIAQRAPTAERAAGNCRVLALLATAATCVAPVKEQSDASTEDSLPAFEVVAAWSSCKPTVPGALLVPAQMLHSGLSCCGQGLGPRKPRPSWLSPPAAARCTAACARFHVRPARSTQHLPGACLQRTRGFAMLWLREQLCTLQAQRCHPSTPCAARTNPPPPPPPTLQSLHWRTYTGLASLHRPPCQVRGQGMRVAAPPALAQRAALLARTTAGAPSPPDAGARARVTGRRSRPCLAAGPPPPRQTLAARRCQTAGGRGAEAKAARLRWPDPPHRRHARRRRPTRQAVWNQSNLKICPIPSRSLLFEIACPTVCTCKGRPLAEAARRAALLACNCNARAPACLAPARPQSPAAAARTAASAGRQAWSGAC